MVFGESKLVYKMILFFSLILLFLGLHSKDKEVELFCCLTFLYNLASKAFPDSSGLVYYGSAGLNDLIILSLIGYYKLSSNLARELQWICTLFIVINFYGWVDYMNYVPGEKSEYGRLARDAYIAAIIVICYRGKFRDVGDITLGSRLTRFFSSYSTRGFKLFRK